MGCGASTPEGAATAPVEQPVAAPEEAAPLPEKAATDSPTVEANSASEFLPEELQKCFLSLTPRSSDTELFYYEGVAGRGNDVWGWYQIVAEFCPTANEIYLEVDFESKNPNSVASYHASNHLTWNQETGAVEQTNGSWKGEVAGLGGVFRLKNKFGDDLNFLPMPFLWHYTLGCKPSEMGALAARFADLLSKNCVPGKRIKVWHDYHKGDDERRYAIEHSPNHILLLSPGIWQCGPAVTDLRAAMAAGKNLVMLWDPKGDETHVPAVPTPFSPVGIETVAADMGQIIGSAPEDLKGLFSDIECLPYRSHPFAELATVRQIARVGGFEGVLADAVTKEGVEALPSPEAVERDVVYYEGTAVRNDIEEGYYQVVATFSPAHDTIELDITYEASIKGWMPSYKGSKVLTWDEASGEVEQTDAGGDETKDDEWTGTISCFGGKFDITSPNDSYAITLNPRPFLWHYYFQGVVSEVGKVSSLLASLLADEAARGRRPRCFKAFENADPEECSSALAVSANFAMFVSKSVWSTETCLRDLRAAMALGKNIILLQEPDARMAGYAPISDIVAAAPEDVAALLATHDVLPYYRRGYEQDALLVHLLKVGGFPECVLVPEPKTSEWFLGSQNLADDLLIMQEDRWKYYEGEAGRYDDIWGWYQIDAKFKPAESAIEMLVTFESKNPDSIPGYQCVNTFEWGVEDGSIKQTNGSWHGELEGGLGGTFHLQNKYGDTLTFHPQSFIWHFFLSHVQREAADSCALLVAKLKEASVIGRHIRVWYDNKAGAINKATMQEGVDGSAVYVLFLTPSVFNSQYVLFEFDTAISKNKNVLLLYHADPESRNYLVPSELIPKAPAKYQSVLSEAKAIAFYESGEGLDSCLRDLMTSAGFEANIKQD